MAEQKNSFAFIVHARTFDDIPTKIWWVRFLSKSFLQWLSVKLKPRVVGKIYGMKNRHGKDIQGWIIGIPATGEQMINDAALAQQRVLESIKIAEKLGSVVIGLGVWLPSITQYGRTLMNYESIANHRIYLTTGIRLTSAISVESVKNLLELRGKNLNNSVVAVIGATENIGKAVATLLVRNGAQNLILINKHTDQATHLKSFLESIEPSKQLSIKTAINLEIISEADLVIVATSSPSLILKPSHFKKNSIIYDITQPQNIPKTVLLERPDLLIIDGELIETPNVFYELTSGIPKNTVYSCVAETMIIAAEEDYNYVSSLDPDFNQIKRILKHALNYGFRIAPFRSFGKIISQTEIQKATPSFIEIAKETFSENKETYNKDSLFWNNYAKIYPYIERSGPYKKLLSDFDTLIPVGKSQDIWLDAGCGSGTLTEIAANKTAGKIVAVDFDELMLNHARKRIEKNKIKNVNFQNIDLRATTPFQNHFFDLIVSNLVLTYIPVFHGYKKKKAFVGVLQEMYRILKPGGLFIWSTPVDNVSFPKVFLASWKDILNPYHPENLYYGPAIMSYAMSIQEKGSSGEYNFLSQYDIKKTLESVGFNNIRIIKTFANQAYLIQCKK